MYFSASTIGFYLDGEMPSDVTHESDWGISYIDLLNGQSDGLRIEPNEQGHPHLIGEILLKD
ncbi:hypothetical protein [Aeromonas media]|uniref:hypothetical protein n=1 Tax=Aeromonas media TaxID=651 RepID=UPI0015FCFE6C|nr:hypothetical protein [Aeromonas media]